MILTQLLALLVMSVFLLVNYKDRFFVSQPFGWMN
jgi:hypothetical protein